MPFDPLDDVPKPKGFPDGPPPRPRDPVEDIFGVGKGFPQKVPSKSSQTDEEFLGIEFED